jgi:hypothetical protein
VQLNTEWINGITLQIRSLTYLTKRQVARLHQDERLLPRVGNFPKQVEELDAKYSSLIYGLTGLATYLSDAAWSRWITNRSYIGSDWLALLYLR